MARKYNYYIVLQQYWYKRWEDIVTYNDNREGMLSCRSDRTCYLKNQPDVPLRIIHRREKAD